MVQDGLPFRSVRQPTAYSTPSVGGGYQGRQINLGDALRGRLAPGPNAGAGMARTAQGFDALAQGISRVAASVQAEELDRQKVDAVSAITEAQTQERELFDQISQMGGKNARGAPDLAKEFYDKKDKELTESARGDYQFMIYKNTMASMRASGLDKATVHARQQEEVFKQQTWTASVANGTERVARDPSVLPQVKADLVQQDRLLHPDLPPEAYLANESAIDSDLLKAQTQGLLSENKFDEADERLDVAQHPVVVPKRAQQYMPLFQKSSEANGVPLPILLALAEQESSFNSNAKNPSSSAKGLMQTIDGTYKSMMGGKGNPYNPADSIEAGARYISLMQKQFGNWADAVAHYYTGPAGGGRNNAEGRKYSNEVMEKVKKFSGGQGYGSDPRTIGTLRHQVQSARNFWESSSRSGAKTLIDGQADAEANARMTGFIDPERTSSIMGNKHIPMDDKQDMFKGMDVAKDVYNLSNSDDGLLKSLSNLQQEVANLHPMPEQLKEGEEATREYKRQVMAFQKGQEYVAEEYNRYIADPLGYNMPGATRMTDKQIEQGLGTEDDRDYLEAVNARRLSQLKGGLTDSQAALQASLSNERVVQLKAQLAETAGDPRATQQFFAGLEDKYKDLYPQVLADIGGGYSEIIAKNFSPVDAQWGELARIAEAKNDNDYPDKFISTERKKEVREIVDNFFDSDISGGVGYFQVVNSLYNARPGEKNWENMNNGLKDVAYKMGYEVAMRKGEFIGNMKEMAAAFNRENNFINNSTAHLVIPKEYDPSKMARGMNVIQSAMGKGFDTEFDSVLGLDRDVSGSVFFRNHGDEVVIDKPSGIAVTLTFQEISDFGSRVLLYGDDTMGLSPELQSRAGLAILLGREPEERTMENQSMSYSRYQEAEDLARALIERKLAPFPPTTEVPFEVQVAQDIATGTTGKLPQPTIVEFGKKKTIESEQGVTTTTASSGKTTVRPEKQVSRLGK